MKKKRAHNPATFLKLLAPHILAELSPPSEVKKFTSNPAVVGAYVEAAVRELVRRHVFPMRVATGAVIDQSNIPGDPKLPQLDTIVWAPSPAPPVFQVGEYALVPRSSSFGILEIKSSAYDVNDLDRRLRPSIIKSVTADQLDGEKNQCGDVLPCLGVICLRANNQAMRGIERMAQRDRVVVLFEEVGNKIVPRPRDIYELVNFLGFLRLRGRLHEGQVRINIDLLRQPTNGLTPHAADAARRIMKRRG
jgi:hypothetical protein